MPFQYLLNKEEKNLIDTRREVNAGDPGQLKVYNGDPWHADENSHCVRLFNGHLQIAKIPKYSEMFEAYWPAPNQIEHMLKMLNASGEQNKDE